MTCQNMLFLVWALFGAMEALCDEMPHIQGEDSSLAIEKVSFKEDVVADDDSGEIYDELRLVENDVKDLVRHSIAHTLHEFSDIRLANLELYIITLKLTRLTGGGQPSAFVVGRDKPYAIVFNRDMRALELKEILEKDDDEKVLTGKVMPLSADSEIIREIQKNGGVSNFRELADTQNTRDYSHVKKLLERWGVKGNEESIDLDEVVARWRRRKNYGFIKESWEPFFRAVGVDFSLEGVATLYDRDLLKSRGIATLYERDVNKAREVGILFDEDMNNNAKVIILYDRDRNKGNIEKGLLIEYIREKKFPYINRKSETAKSPKWNKYTVTKLPELHRYTEDGVDYLIWSIEIDYKKNYIIYTMDKDGNIAAYTIDKNLPFELADECEDIYKEPIWD